MRRLLGVDLGTKRVGLAIAEPEAARARPLTTVARGRDLEADAATIGRIVAANGVGELVVGLPLDMSGAEGPAAQAARAWATGIAGRLGLPVVLRDERLSSHVAEGRLGPARRGRSGGPPGPVKRAAHRARIDREAATVILEDELTARSIGRPGEMVVPVAPIAPAPPVVAVAPPAAAESVTMDGTAAGGTRHPPHEEHE